MQIKKKYLLFIIFLFPFVCQAVTVTPSINSFNAGELSPLMSARSDFTKYNNGCQTLHNMFVLSQGPVTRRPGSKYIAEVKDSNDLAELIPFEFSKTDTYMLEFGDLYMRAFRRGGQIIDPDGTENLTGYSANLVAQWKLNDDAVNTTVVDTVGSHNGVLTTNTGSITTTGKINDCFDMFGLYAIDVTDSDNFTFDDSADKAFSIIAWVYVIPTTYEQIIISKLDLTGTDKREWRWDITTTEKLRFIIYDNDDSDVYVSCGIHERQALSEGWHFVVATYDGRGGNDAGDGLSLYVDGEFSSNVTRWTYSAYVQMRNTDAGVIIGAYKNTSKVRLWHGKLDNIAIFDKELTPTEIAALWDTTADEYELTTTYTDDEVSSLQYVQIADTMYLVSHAHEPRKLTRTGHTAWSIADVNYIDGPFKAENIDESITVTPHGTSSTITLDSNSNIFSANLVGALWEIRHPRTDATVSGSLDGITKSSSYVDCEGDFNIRTHGTWSASVYLERNFGSTTWETVSESFRSSVDDDNLNFSGNEPDPGYQYRVTMSSFVSGTATYTFIVHEHMHTGVGRIASYVDPNEVTITVLSTLGTITATTHWSEGFWSPKNGYPATIEFHEFRLFYGGNANYPQTIWASKSGDETDYESMSSGTDDDDALIYHLPGQNPIQFLHSYDYLIVGTLGGVGRLGGIDEPMTPTTEPSYRQQTPYGSEFLPATSAGDAVLYVGRGGEKVREFAYSLERDRFVSPDLTVLAEHITGEGIVDVAYQIRPDSVLWCVLEDGDMATMTYNKEHDVFAWSLQITDGDYESVAIIPGADEDEIWTIVNRTIDSNSVRYIEQFHPRDWGPDDTDCWFVDSGLSFDGGDAVNISGASKANPCVITVSTWPTDGDGDNLADGDQIKILTVVGMTELNANIYTIDDADVSAKTFTLNDSDDSADIDSTNYTTYTSGGTVQRFEKDFSNLDHVEGEVVAVFADGEARTNNTVSSGAIETSNWYNKVLVGLPYTSIIETMPLVFNTQKGSTSSKYTRIINVAFDLYETLGFSFGIDEDNLITKDFDDMTTGLLEYRFPYGKKRPSTVYVETAKPVPLTIRQIIPMVEIHE